MLASAAPRHAPILERLRFELDGSAIAVHGSVTAAELDGLF